MRAELYVPGGVKRYLQAVGAILVILVGGLIVTRPEPGELKRAVEEAMSAYAQARSVAPDTVGSTGLSVLAAATWQERDYFVVRSYSARLPDGAMFACWGVSRVSFCSEPDA